MDISQFNCDRLLNKAHSELMSYNVCYVGKINRSLSSVWGIQFDYDIRQGEASKVPVSLSNKLTYVNRQVYKADFFYLNLFFLSSERIQRSKLIF